MGEISIRRGERGDLPQLTDLYNHYIENTPTTFDIVPFTVEQRDKAWFSLFRESGRHQLFVAVEDETVLGFVSSRPFRPKAAYETSVETSVYFLPDATGKGLGGRMYERLFAALEEEDIHRFLAGITLPNEPSVKLHERLGFELIGTFGEVGRKFGTFWDVGWYERRV